MAKLNSVAVALLASGIARLDNFQRVFYIHVLALCVQCRAFHSSGKKFASEACGVLRSVRMRAMWESSMRGATLLKEVGVGGEI
jgi:hypothetical protein